MADYTTKAIALRGTPTGTEALLVDEGVTVETLVTEASEQFAADVQPRYWPFPAVDATYPTPTYVQVCVGHLARHKVLHILGRENEMEITEDPNSLNSLAQYTRMKDALMTDPPQAQIPEVVITAELMSFPGVDPLHSDHYIFDPASMGLEGFEVIEESVKVAGMQWKADFDVCFSQPDRAWLFVRNNAAIVNETPVTYRISFLRRREVDRPVSRKGGRFLRA